MTAGSTEVRDASAQGTPGVMRQRPEILLLYSSRAGPAARVYRRAMNRIVYLINCSLDGYIETPDHSLDWTSVDEEVLGWFNDQVRQAGAFLYGTRMYETMAAYWPTGESDPESTPAMREFARIWNARPKIVFSGTLESVVEGCRLVRGDIDGEVATLRELDGELQVAGAELAASFFERGLVDQVRLVVHPVVLGRGTPAFAERLGRIDMRRVETRTFANGAIYLGYEVVR